MSFAKLQEGSLIESTGLPLAAVLGGKRFQFALAPPALRLAKTGYSVPASVFNAVPSEASMQANALVLGATGRPAAFTLDDGKLHAASCLEEITDDGSQITFVDVATFDSRAMSPIVLQCVK